MHPLTFHELGSNFDLNRVIERGAIPSIYFSDDPQSDLHAYTGSYLQQEIVAEGATRNIPAFSRFLKVAALCNAAIVNFTNVANDAQVPRTTIYEYFEILKDTLILHELPPWKRSIKRKPLSSSKYYFSCFITFLHETDGKDFWVIEIWQSRFQKPGFWNYVGI